MSGITTRTMRPFSCGFASRYKGLRYPECNGGMPCSACLQKYKETQSRLLAKKESRRR
jgi:hypothetical protein